MIASIFSILSVDPALEEGGAFYQLQALSDENEGADLLGTKNTDEVQKRWLQIANTTEDLAKSHTDGRLELLRYRADLRLRGIYAALGRLAGAHAGLQVMLESRESAEKIPDTSVPCEVACYFFSDAHLREFTSAPLHDAVAYTPSAMLQTLQSKPTVVKGVAKTDPALQKMQEALGNWGKNHRDILHRLRGARDFLRDLERWLSDNNTFGIAVNAGPIQQWLSRLEDLLLPYVAPSSAVAESGSARRLQPGGAINDALAAPADPNLLRANTVLPMLPAGNANLAIERLTREDVIACLRTLCQWYALYEPGSPAPYFLQRAIRSMNTDFMSILQDLLPESVGAFEKMVGLGAKK